MVFQVLIPFVFAALLGASSAEPAIVPAQRELAEYRKTGRYYTLAGTLKAWKKGSAVKRDYVVWALSADLPDRGLVRLVQHDDLIILYRLFRGDLPDFDNGRFVDQDLFIRGGRAAWAISELTGLELPELNDGLSADEYGRRVAVIREKVRKHLNGIPQPPPPGP